MERQPMTNEVFKSTVQSIADALKWKYQPEKDPYSTRNDCIRIAPDATPGTLPAIRINNGSYKHVNRIVIACEFNGLSDYSTHDDPNAYLITVSPEKTPATIAGDITKRLLPVYLPEITKRQEKKAAAMARGEKARTQVNEIIAASKGLLSFSYQTAREIENNDERARLLTRFSLSGKNTGPGNYYIYDADFSGGDEPHLTIKLSSLNLQQSLCLMDLLSTQEPFIKDVPPEKVTPEIEMTLQEFDSIPTGEKIEESGNRYILDNAAKTRGADFYKVTINDNAASLEQLCKSAQAAATKKGKPFAVVYRNEPAGLDVILLSYAEQHEQDGKMKIIKTFQPVPATTPDEPQAEEITPEPAPTAPKITAETPRTAQQEALERIEARRAERKKETEQRRAVIAARPYYINKAGQWIATPGEPFRVEGFNGLDFFIHREEATGQYKISCGLSGLFIAKSLLPVEKAEPGSMKDKEFRRDCIDKATELLTNAGAEKVAALIEKKTQETGRSPRHAPTAPQDEPEPTPPAPEPATATEEPETAAETPTDAPTMPATSTPPGTPGDKAHAWKLFKEHSKDDFYSLGGKQHAETRALILSELTGHPIPKSKAHINTIQKLCMSLCQAHGIQCESTRDIKHASHVLYNRAHHLPCYQFQFSSKTHDPAKFWAESTHDTKAEAHAQMKEFLIDSSIPGSYLKDYTARIIDAHTGQDITDPPTTPEPTDAATAPEPATAPPALVLLPGKKSKTPAPSLFDTDPTPAGPPPAAAVPADNATELPTDAATVTDAMLQQQPGTDPAADAVPAVPGDHGGHACSSEETGQNFGIQEPRLENSNEINSGISDTTIQEAEILPAPTPQDADAAALTLEEYLRSKRARPLQKFKHLADQYKEEHKRAVETLVLNGILVNSRVLKEDYPHLLPQHEANAARYMEDMNQEAIAWKLARKLQAWSNKNGISLEDIFAGKIETDAAALLIATIKGEPIAG